MRRTTNSSRETALSNTDHHITSTLRWGIARCFAESLAHVEVARFAGVWSRRAEPA